MRFPGKLARIWPAFCRVVVASVLVLALGLGGASAAAQEGESTQEAIERRDNLIAAQETLLNIYRCQFGVDTAAVRGGCTNGYPTQEFTQAAVFTGVPTIREVAVRDRLIALQEALLNVYRCRFDLEIDPDILPEGCSGLAGSKPPASSATPQPVRPEDFAGDLPPGLITPSGVSVAVLGVNQGRFVVSTPCGAISTVSAGVPLLGIRVVIDPGHGGSYDVGAVAPNGFAERDLNLTLGNAVLEELASRGIPAASTRTGHYGSTLGVRSAFANALGAEAMVSIHHNGPTWGIGNRPGTEVYVQSVSAGKARADSARLGGLLHQQITKALSGFDGVSWSRLSDAGVLRVLLPDGRDAYGMVRGPKVPAVIVEYGYLTNRSEAALFATDEYIRVAAKATANAIEAYLNTDRSGTEENSRPRVWNPARAPSSCNEVPLE